MDALQYTVGEDINHPNTFYIHEQFQNGVHGFNAHRDTDHAKDWAMFKNSDPFEEGTGQPCFDFYYCKDTEIKGKIPISKGVYGVHVELYIKEEYVSEFLNVIANNQRGSQNNDIEPLCLQYVYGESIDTPYKYVFHEEYIGNNHGREGFDIHTTTPHFQKWEEFVSKYTNENEDEGTCTSPFTQPPVVNFFKSLDWDD